MNDKSKKILIGVLVVLLTMGGYCLSAWLIKIAWNLIAVYFGVKIINFPIALAMTLISSIIGGFFKSSK